MHVFMLKCELCNIYILKFEKMQANVYWTFTQNNDTTFKKATKLMKSESTVETYPD